jgi:hypothetical protein
MKINHSFQINSLLKMIPLPRFLENYFAEVNIKALKTITNHCQKPKSKKDRHYNGQKKTDKQRSTKHCTENYRSRNTNLTKNPWVNSCAIYVTLLNYNKHIPVFYSSISKTYFYVSEHNKMENTKTNATVRTVPKYSVKS